MSDDKVVDLLAPRQRRGACGSSQMREDALDHSGLFDGADDLHLTATRTIPDVDGEDRSLAKSGSARVPALGGGRSMVV